MQLNKRGAKMTPEETDRFFEMIRTEELYGLKRRLQISMAPIAFESRAQQIAEHVGVPMEDDPTVKVLVADELEDLAGASLVFWEEYASDEVPRFGGWPIFANVSLSDEENWQPLGTWTK